MFVPVVESESSPARSLDPNPAVWPRDAPMLVLTAISTVAVLVGAEVNVTVTVSVDTIAAVETHEIIAYGASSSVAPVNDTETGVTVPVTAAAEAGVTEDRTPKPNADTATSAMRLRSVFVDICFLSISQNQEFPDLGFG